MTSIRKTMRALTILLAGGLPTSAPSVVAAANVPGVVNAQCFADLHMKRRVRTEFRRYRALLSAAREYEARKRPPRDARAIYGALFTTIHQLKCVLRSPDCLPDGAPDKETVSMLVAQAIAADPSLRVLTDEVLAAARKAAEQGSWKLGIEHPDVDFLSSHALDAVAELSEAKAAEELVKEGISPEVLFPCLPPEERAQRTEELKAFAEMELSAFIPLDGRDYPDEMAGQLEEFRKGLRPPRDGYIILRLMQGSGGMPIGMLLMGRPGPDGEARRRYFLHRIYTDPKLAKYRIDRQLAQEAKIAEELTNLIKEHPELRNIHSFGSDDIKPLETTPTSPPQ